MGSVAESKSTGDPLPGIIMSRLFSSPWRILEVMNFAWYSFIWLFIHYFICAAVMAALINQFSER
jgi:hypothetical protein